MPLVMRRRMRSGFRRPSTGRIEERVVWVRVPIRLRCWLPAGAGRPVVRSPVAPRPLFARFSSTGPASPSRESVASWAEPPASPPSSWSGESEPSSVEGWALGWSPDHPIVLSDTGDYIPRSPSEPPPVEVDVHASSAGWTSVSMVLLVMSRAVISIGPVIVSTMIGYNPTTGRELRNCAQLLC